MDSEIVLPLSVSVSSLLAFVLGLLLGCLFGSCRCVHHLWKRASQKEGLQHHHGVMSEAIQSRHLREFELRGDSTNTNEVELHDNSAYNTNHLEDKMELHDNSAYTDKRVLGDSSVYAHASLGDSESD